MDIQPIETWYADTLFRSRLEARWAVYFDAVGIPWEYEPEHYRLGSGNIYLPDFGLFHRKLFAEIKPSGGSFEKAAALESDVLLLDGAPAAPAVYRDNRGDYVYVGHVISHRCTRDEAVSVAYRYDGHLHPVTLRAVQLARSERFGAHAPRCRHLLTIPERIDRFGAGGPGEIDYLCDLCTNKDDLDAVSNHIIDESNTCLACLCKVQFCRCEHHDDCEYRKARQRICGEKFDGRCCLIPEGTHKARGCGATIDDNDTATVELVLEILEGDEVERELFQRWGLDKGTLACLRLLGWRGDDLNDLSGIDGSVDVWVTITHHQKPDSTWEERLTIRSLASKGDR